MGSRVSPEKYCGAFGGVDLDSPAIKPFFNGFEGFLKVFFGEFGFSGSCIDGGIISVQAYVDIGGRGEVMYEKSVQGWCKHRTLGDACGYVFD